MDADALRFPTNFGAELTIAVMSLLQRPRSIANTGIERECLSYYIMASENVFEKGLARYRAICSTPTCKTYITKEMSYHIEVKSR